VRQTRELLHRKERDGAPGSFGDEKLSPQDDNSALCAVVLLRLRPERQYF